MLEETLNKIRGVEKWPDTDATAISTKVSGGYRGYFNTIQFFYASKDGIVQRGKIVADDNASLFGIKSNDTFRVQYDPKKPSRFYCAEADSPLLDIRIAIISAVVIYLAYLVLRRLL